LPSFTKLLHKMHYSSRTCTRAHVVTYSLKIRNSVAPPLQVFLGIKIKLKLHIRFYSKY